MAKEERKPGEFRAGDKVLAIHSDPRGLSGTILLIFPGGKRALVEFPGWTGGHDGSYHWDQSWFPPDLKTPSKSRHHLDTDDFVLVEPAKEELNESGIRIISNTGLTKEIRTVSGGDTATVFPQRPDEYFREGDVLHWERNGKKYFVAGFDSERERNLWTEEEGMEGCGYFTSQEGLYLIQRAGYRWEAGARVAVREGSPLSGETGQIVLIDPEKNYRYLVEFADEPGSGRMAEWDSPWFSQRFKNDESLWIFFEEHELEEAGA